MSTVQSTRSALAYGSVVITCSASGANGAIPAVSSLGRWPVRGEHPSGQVVRPDPTPANVRARPLVLQVCADDVVSAE